MVRAYFVEREARNSVPRVPPTRLQLPGQSNSQTTQKPRMMLATVTATSPAGVCGSPNSAGRPESSTNSTGGDSIAELLRFLTSLTSDRRRNRRTPFGGHLEGQFDRFEQ